MLGLLVLALAMIETVAAPGAHSLLPPAAAFAAAHWALGVVLVLASMAAPGTARMMDALVGLVFVAGGVVSLVASAWLGQALGLGGRMPSAAGWLHLALGVLAVGLAAVPVPSRA
ncbi:MAG: hypothetical protein ACE14W_03310 [Candidatus Velamenicoccus archaeovorus]